MSTRRIRNWWWVDVRVNGSRHRVRCPVNNQTSARQYEHLLRQRLMMGEPLKPVQVPVQRFDGFSREWLATYVATNNKPSEQVTKRVILERHLIPFFGERALPDCTKALIERYKATKLAEKLAPKTINNHLAILLKCLRSAADDGHLETLPRAKFLAFESGRIDFLSRDEATALASSACEPMWGEMAILALRTGMRMGELFGLEWDAIDFDRAVVAIRRSIVNGIASTPKSGKSRHVPLTEDVLRLLAARRKRRGLVFHRPDGRPFSHRMAANAIRRLCKRAGIRQVSWHILRHTFASHLVTAGVPIRAVQVLLGHSSVAMTERYSHLAPSTFRDARMVLEQLARGVPASVHGHPVGNSSAIHADPGTSPLIETFDFSAEPKQKQTSVC